MGEPGIGQIILIVAFIVVLVVKTVLQQARRRPGIQMPNEEKDEEPVMKIRRQARPVPVPPPAYRAPPSRVRESQAPDAGTPAAGIRFAGRSVLQTPRDARRGIILMTILGPCRAFDPPDQS